MDEYIKAEESTASADLSKEINKTYVVSTTAKCGGQRNPTHASGRLTLQRRKTDNKDSVKMASENAENHLAECEKRLTLQRRTRTGSVDKKITDSSKAAEKSMARGPNSSHSKVLLETNCRPPQVTPILRSVSLKDTGFKSTAKEGINNIKTLGKGIEKQKLLTVGKVNGKRSEDQSKIFSTPTKQTPFENITLKKDIFERLATREIPKIVTTKSANLERQNTPAQLNGGRFKSVAHGLIASRNNGVVNHARNMIGSSQSTQVKKGTILTSSCQNRDLSTTGCASISSDHLTRESGSVKKESYRMENSAVTVAVRVRPFNSREKTENARQVVFVNNQETTVQHPDSKQSFSFFYDFSFCSIDETKSDFASQQTVFEKLARPLLERAFEGYNTCLFAYGQTGSGKSYTMMGFGEEAGVTPRFCEELFSRVTSSENKQITCHLEMSYFEVYNEKIHDLLVVKDEQSEKKLPLRVREHPVFGPYVADLSTNVVSSYSDILGWLELGNKQRATAATGMNDKSSRSHSVFTLVMTQTKTEFVEDEEHDHRIISRINLVDLAGSERCSSAQTSGDRLREGASINKSLLTLGKVISALSEQSQIRKRVFIPYRESVLTWLLKESLGGNSKTAMIATLSPAASNVEETLSTLRYAKQARMIINVAMVNEDTNAKLIRELKAEVDKLRAAQMSSQGIEPEKMRLFQQEIAALKTQLTQQEREMAEAHRTWKDKLEKAEKRKREETKELQKAGITFKVDNRLPNLVNLNEDPQLSEMLLYMIKEGQTKVGKHRSESAHDIQLSGALIADEHCVISNVSGTVSLTPIKDAKTFVNGSLVSESTVLHHGDRVILGGDHYFRFNHPVEVQSGKRVSCWSGPGDGQKDFEFAKNELLASQRAQLEAEIEEARLKAKEEMMQGIQVAKEMAQKELSNQKMLYENKIKALVRELEEESQRKKCQELDNQRVASQMEELQTAKILLEQEVQMNKKRLHMEAQATRQAMVDHDIRHAKFIEALEAEKRKIAEDLDEIQKRRGQKANQVSKDSQPQWDAMKLSVMIEEANTISRKLRKSTVFSRHEPSDKEGTGGQRELQIHVQNTKLGIATFWSLEKFQSNLAAMRELEKGDCTAKDDDVFYDPNDEWEQDISASVPASSFSRRRSRSLLKSKRISGRLYEIRVHPIQSLHSTSSQHSGLIGTSKPPSLQANAPDSALPGICKDLICSAMDRLRQCQGAQESMADHLVSDLLTIHAAVVSISGLYERLDDDGQENLFVCSKEAQTQLVKATSAIERAAFVTALWIFDTKGCSSVFHATEELKTEVKKMGGYFQLLIQGCDADITSMVSEANSKTRRSLDTTLRLISHLSAVTGTKLQLTEMGSEAVSEHSVEVSLFKGSCKGVSTLLQEGLRQAEEMQRLVQLTAPGTQILQNLKKIILDVVSSLQSYLSCKITRNTTSEEDEPTDPSDLCSVRNTAAHLFQLNQAARKLHSTLIQTLTDNETNFSNLREAICSSSKSINDAINGLPREKETISAAETQFSCMRSDQRARDAVHSDLQSLLAAYDQMCSERNELSGEESNVGKSAEGGPPGNEDVSVPSQDWRNRMVSKMEYALSSEARTCLDDVQWV